MKSPKNNEDKLNILAVGSHPDDIEMGCGGTLLKHIKRKDNVYVLILTNGDAGGHAPNLSECYNCLKVLGIPKESIYFGNFKDGYLIDNLETVSLIENIIKDKKIDRIYTHDHNDRHQDHRNCSKSVSSAGRCVREIFLYQGPSTEVTFEPHYYIEIDENDLNKKIFALKKYKTQVKKGIVNLEWVKGIARINGIKNKTEFAEAFSLNHLFRGDTSV